MNETELLQKLIPYRMQAIDTLNYALRLRSSWSDGCSAPEPDRARARPV